MKLHITIQHGETILAQSDTNEETTLVYQATYQSGDSIAVSSDEKGFAMLNLEATLGPVLVYMKAGTFLYPIPFDEKKLSYNPLGFTGNLHYLSARTAWKWETEGRRDLAYNPLDCHENAIVFPHAHANVETRGESVFAARNAIDGILANHKHGNWPYSSWGINRDPKAALTVEFGRQVIVEAVILHTRADFPHDAWWTEAKVTTDTGITATLPLTKSDKAQYFPFDGGAASSITLHDLIKADDPSPFPALTQLMVIGREKDDRWIYHKAERNTPI